MTLHFKTKRKEKEEGRKKKKGMTYTTSSNIDHSGVQLMRAATLRHHSNFLLELSAALH